jgi:hypothetical protein
LLEAIEAVLDQITIVVHPPIDVSEGLGPQGVETSLAVRADSNEPTVVENPEVARDPGLTYGKSRHKGAYRPLAAAQLLNDAQSGSIRQHFEGQSRSRHGRDICTNIYKQ